MLKLCRITSSFYISLWWFISVIQPVDVAAHITDLVRCYCASSLLKNNMVSVHVATAQVGLYHQSIIDCTYIHKSQTWIHQNMICLISVISLSESSCWGSPAFPSCSDKSITPDQPLTWQRKYMRNSKVKWPVHGHQVVLTVSPTRPHLYIGHLTVFSILRINMRGTILLETYGPRPVVLSYLWSQYLLISLHVWNHTK